MRWDFLCREAGTPAQLGREGVGVDPGETGELGDIEQRGKAGDFFGGEVRCRDGLLYLRAISSHSSAASSIMPAASE